MFKRIFYSLLIILILAGATVTIVAFARGYRFDFDQRIVTSTGLMTINSFPDGASIFINDKLTSATNTSINIIPGHYDLKIAKEGYIPWQKKVTVQGEIVTKIDALLLPQNPSLRPLTTAGVLSPVLSPSRTQLAYIVPLEATTSSALKSKAGIWIWNLQESPLLSIGSGPKLLTRSNTALDFTNAQILWSPDEKKILLLLFKNHEISGNNLIAAYTLDTGREDQVPTTAYDNLAPLLADWRDLEKEKDKTLFASLPLKLNPSLRNAADNIEFSADENKIMYEATASASLPEIITPRLIGTNSTPEERNIKSGNIYIYDIKEDRNYKVKAATDQKSLPEVQGETLSAADEAVSRLPKNQHSLQWYPDSKHIITLENNTIYIMEYDAQNKTTVYAGPIEDSYLFPWPGGGRILILTNLNKAASAYPNLYAVDLR